MTTMSTKGLFSKTMNIFGNNMKHSIIVWYVLARINLNLDRIIYQKTNFISKAHRLRANLAFKSFLNKCCAIVCLLALEPNQIYTISIQILRKNFGAVQITIFVNNCKVDRHVRMNFEIFDSILLDVLWIQNIWN